MGKIFISYRREVGHFVDRLAEKLEGRISGKVFVDLTGINEPDFENVLMREIHDCDIFLLIVTPQTFDPTQINKEEDWVRREIAAALNSTDLYDGHERPKPIVLVLVEGCSIPDAGLLPEDIRKITTKQGIEFYRRFFDAGVEYLAQFCEQIKPEQFHRQPALYVPGDRNLEIRLKQSVREAIDHLVKQIVRDTRQSADESNEGIIYNAWTTAEALIALLYTDASMISSSSDKIDQGILAKVGKKLIHIDTYIDGGGIPAIPDLGIANRGVVDSTSIVIKALCSLRLYMFRYSLSFLKATDVLISLIDLNVCIERLCTWIRQNQNEDGGWGLWRGTKSRVTATAYSVLALMAAGSDPEDDFLQNAQNWLIEMQRDDGWWALTSDSKEPDVTSTAFALAALSMLCNSIMQENIRKAVYALETNTNWEDAEHQIEIPPDYENPSISMLYASEPRAVYALLLAGVSPASPKLLTYLSEISEAELPTGGWTAKRTRSRKLNVWYTYVVIECIYTWFTHSNKISYLTQLSQMDQALSGIIKMYQEKDKESHRLNKKLEEIQTILAM